MGVSDRLGEYRRKRDASRTPEPVPAGPRPTAGDDTFVIQQHHARRLHWDVRLEHDGVLVSWAVPRGLPHDPAHNHLAVHTEDHPLEYLDFEGVIPQGEYGGGRMIIHDRGTYAAEKWRDDEVIVVFSGTRTRGRYVLFRTRGKDWMVHRMDPPDPSWMPMPEQIRSMRPVAAQRLPRPARAWAYEMKWDGMRALGFVSGGRLRLAGPDGTDVTDGYPSVKGLGECLAPTEVVLDGQLVTFGASPVYLLFDLLWLDGVSTVVLPYRQRRQLLEDLALAGPHWQTPPYFPGTGRDALRASREQGLPGVVAKLMDSPYRPGERSADWQTLS